jgi:enoyl-CoA hydratase/carnithine racemase
LSKSTAGADLMSTSTKISTEDLIIRRDTENVATITLNRPKAYNALSKNLMSALQKNLDYIKNNPEIVLVIIKGSGPGFSAGHDLKEMRENRGEKFFGNSSHNVLS